MEGKEGERGELSILYAAKLDARVTLEPLVQTLFGGVRRSVNTGLISVVSARTILYSVCSSKSVTKYVFLGPAVRPSAPHCLFQTLRALDLLVSDSQGLVPDCCLLGHKP